MITDKQRQRDYEYDGDYQSKSRYSTEQWTNILSSGQLSSEDTDLLKQIYSSYNHAATLLQLAFHGKTTEEELLARINAMGQPLAEANEIAPEVDFSGEEYWWFLFFWGKQTDAGTLEVKIQPELTEAIGSLWPELEESYYENGHNFAVGHEAWTVAATFIGGIQRVFFQFRCKIFAKLIENIENFYFLHQSWEWMLNVTY